MTGFPVMSAASDGWTVTQVDGESTVVCNRSSDDVSVSNLLHDATLSDWDRKASDGATVNASFLSIKTRSIGISSEKASPGNNLFKFDSMGTSFLHLAVRHGHEHER